MLSKLLTYLLSLSLSIMSFAPKFLARTAEIIFVSSFLVRAINMSQVSTFASFNTSVSVPSPTSAITSFCSSNLFKISLSWSMTKIS